MSLLMEALRKAEEAKRQAAQKEKDEPDLAAPARNAEVLPVEDPVAMEAQWDATPTATSAAPQDIVLDLGGSSAAQDRVPSLDVPFDFHIDESFGALDLKPVSASAPEPVVSDLPENPEPEPALETLDPEIDYLKPEDLRQFKPASETAPAVVAAPPTAFTLTLEEEPERPESRRAAFIADPEPSDVSLEVLQEPTPVPEQETVSIAAPEPVVTPPPVAAPIRASRVDDAQEPEPLGIIPERPRFKVPGLKATEENRKRESARAVFNAKTGQEPKGRNTRRLIAVAAVLALIPLAGGGYLLVQELGLLGGGNQYNIPASAYNNVPQMPVFEEQSAVAVAEVQLADVTQEVVAEQTLPSEPAASDPAAVVESLVADISPVATDLAPLAMEVPAETLTVLPEPAVEPPLEAEEESSLAAEPATDVAGSAVAEADNVDSPVAPEAVVDTAPAVEIAVQQTPAPVTATPPPAPINITRSSAAPQVNAQLTQAYSAFRDQDFYAARALYQQALRELPNNRDALLGLAATSIQLGDVTGARATYSKLLELDPRDALARIGLMDSMPLGDSIQMETQLQQLKAEHPEVAQLSFALGNFYASQRRWNEAQAAYYDALLAAKAESGSAVSPDFAFNLAVSLERLNQTQPAFNFYREALEQSRLVNPGFDVRVLRERLDALERALP